MDIAIGGPESSGKTTLAIALALHFKTFYIPEYARVYLERHGPSYGADDLKRIIENQLHWWQTSGSAGSQRPLRFLDGDASILRVWEQERFKMTSLSIEHYLKALAPSLTLLCAPDLPWTFDPLRENPYDREQLYEKYRSQLERWKLPYKVIEGNQVSRIDLAIRTVQSHLNTSKFNFANPTP